MKIKNKKALFEYEILEKFELGIALNGSEVKSIRLGKVSLNNAYLAYKAPHIMICDMQIGNYLNSFDKNIDSMRNRIMLVHKKQKNKMIAIEKIPGKTIVPLEGYWNKNGFFKLLCAIAQGKTNRDKREQIKEREWNRQKAEAFKYR